MSTDLKAWLGVRLPGRLARLSTWAIITTTDELSCILHKGVAAQLLEDHIKMQHRKPFRGTADDCSETDLLASFSGYCAERRRDLSRRTPVQQGDSRRRDEMEVTAKASGTQVGMH